MTDQKNPPRTRGVGIGDILKLQLMGQTLTDGAIQDALQQEYARGRAEALAELRAGGEPTKYEVRDLRDAQSDWLTCSQSGYETYQGMPNIETRALYDHPPVPREAELAAEVERLRGALEYAERWSDRAHTACMGTGPKQALGEMLCALRDFLRTALAEAPETRG